MPRGFAEPTFSLGERGTAEGEVPFPAGCDPFGSSDTEPRVQLQPVVIRVDDLEQPSQGSIEVGRVEGEPVA